MAGNLTEAKGFLARVTPAEEADRRNQDEADLDENFAAVEPVDWVALQARRSEKAMEEQSRGSEIDAEVEGLPKPASQTKPQKRSDDHESEEVKSDGADSVFQRLAGGMDGVDEVQKAKARIFVQKQDCWMKN